MKFSPAFFAGALLVCSLLSGCGGDDAPTQVAPAPTPAPPTQSDDPSTDGNWLQVDFRDLSSNPPSSCTEPERFTVDDTGVWTFNFCETQNTGQVTPEELAEIKSLTESFLADGIEAEFCLEIAFDGHEEVELTLRPAQVERVHDLSIRGSCYRGKPSLIDPIKETMDRLRLKYAGFETADAVAN